jgi:hypothetical protein
MATLKTNLLSTPLEAASRMAVLLSALPTKERATAHAELIGQVSALQRPAAPFRSLYPSGSVVGQEVARIAELVSRDLGKGQFPVGLWSDFNSQISAELALIEGDARQAIVAALRSASRT